jgi:hypothetical protein
VFQQLHEEFLWNRESLAIEDEVEHRHWKVVDHDLNGLDFQFQTAGRIWQIRFKLEKQLANRVQIGSFPHHKATGCICLRPNRQIGKYPPDEELSIRYSSDRGWIND